MRIDTATKNADAGYSASPPAVSLPKGGGAIQGIGEKFSVNPVTGTGSLSVPIAVSPGRAGFSPGLTVSYDSGGGNGLFGMGWSLGVPSITRKTQKGLPQYLDNQESDEFLLSGTEDLVPALTRSSSDIDASWSRDEKEEVSPETRLDKTILIQKTQQDAFLSSFPYQGVYTVRQYRPRTEGLFARIERWQHQETGDIHWRTTTPDNVTSVYGKDEDSRIADPDDLSKVFEWLLCETYDDKGNVIVYRYKSENAVGVKEAAPQERNRRVGDSPEETLRDRITYTNRYLKQILYGNRKPYLRPEAPKDWLFQVVFEVWFKTGLFWVTLAAQIRPSLSMARLACNVQVYALWKRLKPSNSNQCGCGWPVSNCLGLFPTRSDTRERRNCR